MSYVTLLLFIILNTHASESLRTLTPQEFPFIVPISVENPNVRTSKEFLDTDEDGIIDVKDKCPDTLPLVKTDAHGCKILKDHDKDGISDKEDKCPKSKSNVKVDKNGCESDTDGDGVKDSSDACADTSKDYIVDVVGCPQTPIPHITFKSHTYTLTNKSLNSLEEFAMFLNENEEYQVIIYGYTDNTGTNNKVLSQRRAISVLETLRKSGIKLIRLTAIGMGSKNPIADNDTPEGRAKNRRIEVELLQ
ncbi:OmpA family protein [Sulfurimonas sp. SAG-AH-194-I05]|nr:OmpA family protein [Sulfurimonas sp. SAG-AH-194-I05]MDF1875756.1 OmpA family protein [Sulfurimonas sp. SAG-AH-194-I05]